MELRKYFSKFLSQRKKILSEKDLKFKSEIEKILDVKINDLQLYREAFSLKNGTRLSNSKNYERMEFLGDSILGSIISCHLFHIYTKANEGYLTQMKSKIVNRKNLNKLGEDLRLIRFIQNANSSTLSENIYGNLFEAFIGAIYLDVGYEVCKKIVLEKMLTDKHIYDLENKIVSYKGLLLEWSQKNKVIIRYETSDETLAGKTSTFRCTVWLDQNKIANATESSKKKAEEKAAQRAFYGLNKKEKIIGNSKAFT